MLNWSIEEKRLDLQYNWKISRNESSHKINFFVVVASREKSGIGEAAPNIRYQETPQLIKEQFEHFKYNFTGAPDTISEFNQLLDGFTLCNSLRFAIESSYTHYLCQKNQTSISKMFSIPPPPEVFTSYTIPIMEPDEVKSFFAKHHLHRFKSIKIKINTEGLELVREVAKQYHGPIRIDANEAWKDVENLLLFMEKLRSMNIEFIEQPLPYDFTEEYFYLKKNSPYPLMGDESITSEVDFNLLKKQFHGINMKLMKAGGYQKGISILKSARTHGLKTMIGCMVETTLGISSGLRLCGLCDYADLDGHFVIAHEPFGMVKEEDGKLLLAKK